MNRRDLLKLTTTLAAAPVGLTAQESARPASEPNWTPAVLDEHQNATVVVLSDLIIPATDTPGAKAAQVNRYVDLLLRDGPDEQREQFLSGLGWLDGYSRRRFQHAFVACAREHQIELLEDLAAGGTEDIAPGHRFFNLAKRLIASIYYNTEIGYAELNKGNRVPDTFACGA